MANQILVCKTSDLAPGEMKRVEHADQGLAVYNVDGTFYVTSDRCTHGLSNLSEGVVMGTGDVRWPLVWPAICAARGVSFIPEVWQGHKDRGAGFWHALDLLDYLDH